MASDHKQSECTDDECIDHGDQCGCCGAYILEALTTGMGEVLAHNRYGVDCRSAKTVTAHGNPNE